VQTIRTFRRYATAYDRDVMAAERDDLGALFARVTRRLVAEERPLLDAHGMTMWEYVALSHLGRGAAGSQLAMAEAIGYDKTRLIALLEGLEGRGLVRREPDPRDRRARVVRLTPAGTRALRAARTDIRRMERRVLSDLSAEERDVLLAVLPRLA
jgi:DNA-binding MarR family transcriptional regulator